MKSQKITANGRARLAQSCRLLCTIIFLTFVATSPIAAQDYSLAQISLRIAGAHLASDLAAEPAELHEDEFQTDIAPREEVSSINMAGKPAEALPCEQHIRANSNDTIPSVDPVVQTTSVNPAAGGSDQPDNFLVYEIRAVQRMIRLMQLKEEIMVEKARFEQKLVDLQKKIESR
jgi:hypothetical protein